MSRNELEVIEREIASLQDEVMTIQSQLADRDKRDPHGQRMDSIQYHQWRRQAVHALTKKTEQLRLLKRHAHSLRMERTEHEPRRISIYVPATMTYEEFMVRAQQEWVRLHGQRQTSH